MNGSHEDYSLAASRVPSYPVGQGDIRVKVDSSTTPSSAAAWLDWQSAVGISFARRYRCTIVLGALDSRPDIALLQQNLMQK